MWHSCKPSIALSVHFRNRPLEFRRIFKRIRNLLGNCGPLTVYARSGGIVFQVRVRFGGVRVRKNYVEVSLWLERRVKHPTLVRTTAFSEIGSHGFAHYFHFTATEQVDRQFAELVRQAYAVGAQTSRSREGEKKQTQIGRSRGRPDL
jgi:hypothetical protein